MLRKPFQFSGFRAKQSPCIENARTRIANPVSGVREQRESSVELVRVAAIAVRLLKLGAERVLPRGVPSPRDAATASHNVAEDGSVFKRLISFEIIRMGEP